MVRHSKHYEYSFEFHSVVDDAELLEHVRGCIGSRILEASIETDFALGKIETDTVSLLFDGMKTKKLNVSCRNISDLAAKTISELIADLNVDRLSIDLYECSMTDSAIFFRDISTHVQFLIIKQNKVYSSEPVLFANHSLDWAAIIIEIFSRNLDKLYIQNDAYLEYLPYESVAELTKIRFLDNLHKWKDLTIFLQHLPLLDKKVWLSISCNHFPDKKSLNGELYDTIFGVSKVTRPDQYRALTIKHASRLHEKL